MTVTEMDGGVGPVIVATLLDLAPLGYSRAEYTLDGTAAAFRRHGTSLKVIEQADYATRLFDPLIRQKHHLPGAALCPGS